MFIAKKRGDLIGEKEMILKFFFIIFLIVILSSYVCIQKFRMGQKFSNILGLQTLPNLFGRWNPSSIYNSL